MPTEPEVFTTYTETDPDARLTVTADRVTVAPSAGNSLDYVNKNHKYINGVPAFTGMKARFKGALTAVPAAPPAFFAEVDPNNRFVVTPKIWGETEGRVDYTGMDSEESCYVVSDYGSAYFNANFTHDVTFNFSSIGGTIGRAVLWALKNVSSIDLTVDLIRLTVLAYPSGSTDYYLVERYGGTQYYVVWSDVTGPITRYISMERDESIGTYGRLYCRIYSDPAKGTLLQTLQLDLHAKVDFQYRYWIHSVPTAQPTNTMTGYVKSTDGPYITYLPLAGFCGVTNSGSSAVNDWTSGALVNWTHDRKLAVFNPVTKSIAFSAQQLTLSTEYFFELRRHSKWFKILVYSDAAYTNLVTEAKITDLPDNAQWKYCYPVITGGYDSNGFGYYIDSLQFWKFEIAQFTDIGRNVPDTTYSTRNDFEGTFPTAGWTANNPAGTTIEHSATWAKEGTQSLHIVGKSDGTADASITYAFIAGDKNNQEASAFIKPISVADGHRGDLFGWLVTYNNYGVHASYVQVNGVYRWAIYARKDSVWYEFLGDVDNNPVMGQEYFVKLHSYLQTNQSRKTACLLVNGCVAVEADLLTLGFEGHFPSKWINGDSGCTLRSSYAERYIDGFHANKRNSSRMGSLAVHPSSGNIVIDVAHRWCHPPDVTTDTQILKSTDGGQTLVWKQAINQYDPGNEEDLGVMSFWNGNYYIFHHGALYTGGGGGDPWDGANYASSSPTPYKSVDGGETFAQISPFTALPLNRKFTVSALVESNKVLGTSNDRDIMVSDPLYFATYNLTTDVFSEVSVIAEKDGAGYPAVFTAHAPVEPTLYRRPSDNALVCIIRWQTPSGTLNVRPGYCVSTDNGATWSLPIDLQDEWGHMGAGMEALVVNGFVWVLCAPRHNGEGFVPPTRNVILQCDPDSLAVLNSYSWSFFDVGVGSDTGNGDVFVGGYDDVVQKYYLWVLAAAQVAGLYKIYIPEDLELLQIIPLALQNIRGGFSPIGSRGGFVNG